MMLRQILRTTIFAFFLALLALPSQAHDRPWHGDVLLQFEFGEYRYPEPAWAAGGISCRGGWKIVKARGFYHVDPLDCHGRTFTYLGRWRGDTLRIFVDSATGRIIGVGPA
jgi:hypothetical protein